MTSCKDKPKPNPQTTFEQSMTNKDSVAVTGLVNVFFQLAESGRYDEAASMLFKNNVDTVYDEPKPLDNKDMEKVKTLLSSLPIQSHTIDYIKFKEVYENEVKCTAIIMEAHDNIPEVKTYIENQLKTDRTAISCVSKKTIDFVKEYLNNDK